MFKPLSISEGAQLDLRAWLEFIEYYNGVTVITQERWVNSREMSLYTDASGEIGYGGYFRGFNGKWFLREIITGTSIAWKELVPIVFVVLIWGDELKNTDNMSVMYSINK